jgi:2,4-dienoyl-CoA reductase-like NADH-dependent reductase (Old Yellow Enzyme family)
MASARFDSEAVDPSPLGQPLPFAFSGQTAPNRFLKAAMTERLSTWDATDKAQRGVPTEQLVNVYRRWGEGGWGTILTGNIMMEYDQLEAPGNAIVPRDAPFSGERFDAFRRLAEAAKAHGDLIVGQVSHPGRQVPEFINPHPVSASDVQLEGQVMGMTFGKPRAMEQKDIDDIIASFVHTAEYLYKAGYDGMQLHGAHGYLLAQFLAPSTNKRTDKYGGPLLNRARIILEIADAAKLQSASRRLHTSEEAVLPA